jgi:hypothetical protein
MIIEDPRPKTIFCDIDGTLVRHHRPTTVALAGHEMELLPGTHKKLLEWDKKAYRIILTTGRKESLRSVTESQLAEAGIIYDQLLMGIGGGVRVLINDRKPDGTFDTALAINLVRDQGIGGLDI